MARSSLVLTRLAGAALCLGGALSLAGCGGDDTPTPGPTDATSAATSAPSRSAVISPPSLRPIPTLASPSGIVRDTTMTACTQAQGPVSANGTVKNSGSDTADLVVVVSWVLPQGNDVVARGVATIKDAEPGSTHDWKVTAAVATDQPTQCVLSSRRGTL